MRGIGQGVDDCDDDKSDQKLADEQDETEVCCHFCDKKYSFTAEELRELLKNA